MKLRLTCRAGEDPKVEIVDAEGLPYDEGHVIPVRRVIWSWSQGAPVAQVQLDIDELDVDGELVAKKPCKGCPDPK